MDAWLRPPATRDSDAVELAHSLFAPPPADWLVATPVSKYVSNVAHDDPACIEPVTPEGGQEPLF